MICVPCQRDQHEYCAPVPDPEREMTFMACSCLHDPALLDRRTKGLRFLARAIEQLDQGDEVGCVGAAWQLIRLLAPPESPKGRVVGLGARSRLRIVPNTEEGTGNGAA